MIVRRMVPSEGAWLRNSGELNELRRQMQSLMAVSYTHLTLPTILRV